MSLFYPKLFNEDLATVEREQPRLPEYIDSLKKTRGSSAPNRRERVQPTNPYCGTAEKTVQSDADLEAVPTSYMRWCALNLDRNPSQPRMIIYFWGPDLESWKCIYHLKIRQQLKRKHLAAGLKK